MPDIYIKSIGKERSQEILSLQSEYIKRMKWKVNLQEHPQHSDSSAISIIKNAESKILLTNLSSASKVIVLDESGALYSSTEFAGLFQLNPNVKEYTFLIGGAYGHSDELKNSKYQKLSISKMTLPHKLVRLILIEQIYRAYTIINKHPYHKI